MDSEKMSQNEVADVLTSLTDNISAIVAKARMISEIIDLDGNEDVYRVVADDNSPFLWVENLAASSLMYASTVSLVRRYYDEERVPVDFFVVEGEERSAMKFPLPFFSMSVEDVVAMIDDAVKNAPAPDEDGDEFELLEFLNDLWRKIVGVHILFNERTLTIWR